MRDKNIKRKYLQRPLVTGFFVLSLMGIFLFTQNSQAAPLLNDYNKTASSTLAASEWNTLLKDFLNVEGGRVNNFLGINAATSSFNILNVGGRANFDYPIIVGAPTDATHAATRGYVDSVFSDGAYWGVNGTNLFNTNTGNVGIGTTGPNTVLHINKINQDNTPMFKLTGIGNYVSSPTDTANGVGIGLVYNGTGNRQFWIGDSANGFGVRINGFSLGGWNYINSTDNTLSIDSNSAGVNFQAGKVIINTNGNVGIGTTTPTTKLSISGGTSNALFMNGGQIGGLNSTPLNTDHAVPLGYLQANYLSSSAASSTGWLLSGNSVAADNSWLGTISNYDVSFRTNNIERMRILKGGNVGIGTTNPLSKFNVEGNNSSGVLTLSNSNVTIPAGDIVGQIDFYTKDGSAIVNRVVASIKSVADVDYTGAQAPTSLSFFTQKSNGVGEPISEKMRIANDGNVGIGTTNPLEKLEVNNGNIATINGGISSPFGGFGQGQNLVAYSEQPSQWANWNLTITDNTTDTVAPNGSYSASKIVVGGLGTYGYNIYWDGVSLTAGQTYTTSIWLKGAVGGERIAFGFSDFDMCPQLTLITSWKRYVCTKTSLVASQTNRKIQFYPQTTGTTYYAWGAQTENSATPSAYVKTGATQILNTNRGLVANGYAKVNGNMDVAGNIGIGTTTPNIKLTVNGGTGDVVNVNGGQIAGLNSTPLNTDHAVPLGYLQANYLSSAPSSSTGWLLSGNSVATDNSWLGTISNYDVSFRTNNTERMRILKGGDVGIGTTTPAAKLDVLSSANSGIWLRDTSNNVVAALSYQSGQDAMFGGGEAGRAVLRSEGRNFIIGTNNASNYIAFGTGLAEKMRIAGNGNIGIGTTAPTKKLVVLGAGSDSDPIQIAKGTGIGGLLFSFDAAGNYPSSIRTYESSGVVDSYMSFKVNNGINSAVEAMKLIAVTGGANALFTGNIGIGTTTPAIKLTVNGGTGDVVNVNGGQIAGLNSTPVNVDQAVPLGYLQSNYLSSAPSSSNGWLLSGNSVTSDASWLGTISNYDVSFRTNNAERMRILKGGNVGIGTTAPAGKLNISEVTGIVSGPVQGTFILDHQNGGGASSMVFPSTVNRGSDYGFIQYQDASTVGAGGESARLIIGTSNDMDDHLLLMPSGNVGIGTTNPVQKLHLLTGSGVDNFIKIESGSYQGVSGLDFTTTYVSTPYSSKILFDYEGGNYGSGLATHGMHYISGRPGLANHWFMEEDGTVQMVIKDGGNVGIGTTNPLAKLNVVGSFQVGDSTILSASSLVTRTNGAITANIHTYIPSNNSPTYQLIQGGTWSTERAGTTQASTAQYQVTVPAANYNSFGYINTIGSFTAGNMIDVLTLNNGNVGIGTTTPSIKLSVNGGTGNVLFMSGGQIAGLNSTPFNSDHAVPLGYLQANYGSTASELWKGTKNGNIWNGDAGVGNVGIGTTAPSEKLHVSGNMLISGATKFANEYMSEWLTVNPFDATSDTAYLNFGQLRDFGHLHIEVEITGWANNALAYGSLVKHFEIRPRNNSGTWTLEGISSRVAEDSGFVSGTVQLGEIEVVGSSFRVPIKKVAGTEQYKIKFRATSWNGAIMNDFAPTITQPAVVSAGSREYTKINNRLGVGLSQGLQPSTPLHVVGNSYFNGNVGIGTTNPLEKLDISGVIRGGDTASTNGSLILVGQYSGNQYPNTIGAHWGSAGTVIGYAVKPKNGATGYVSSADNIAWTRGALNLDQTGLHVLTGAAQSVAINSDVAMTEKFTVTNMGNVGIGTTTPLIKLSVNSGTGDVINVNGGQIAGLNSTPVNNDQAVPLIYLKNNYVPIGAGTGGIGSGIAGQTLRHNGTSWVANSTLYNDGTNIGIGTTSPITKLHLGGTGNKSIRIDSNTNNAGYFGVWQNMAFISTNRDDSNGTVNQVAQAAANIRLFTNNADSYISFATTQSNNADPSERMRINSSGNIGVGTTAPLRELNVYSSGNGGIRTTSQGSSFYFETVARGGSGTIDWDINIGNDSHGIKTPMSFQGTTGNVGIGTTNPAGTKLFIDSDQGTTNNAALKIVYQGATTVLGEVAALAHRNNQWNGLYVNGTGSSLTNAVFVEGNKPVILNAGNVGIGTTTPSIKLSVNGGTGNVLFMSGGQIAGLNSTPFNSDHAVPLGYLQANYGSTASELWKGTKNGNIWNGDAGVGNVGVGTTNPGARLEVVTGAAPFYATKISYPASAQALYSGQVATMYSFIGDSYYYNSTLWRSGTTFGSSIKFDNGAIRFNANSGLTANTDYAPTERFTISSNGNIGIGTTTPAIKLSVSGGTSDVINVSGGQIAGLNSTPLNPDHAVPLGYLQSNYLSSAPSSSNGWLLSGNTVTTDNSWLGTISNYDVSFKTNNTERMRILKGGNVGIGTISPIYKLHVDSGLVNIVNGYSEPTADVGFRLKFSDNGGINNDSGIGMSGALGSESLWINNTPAGDIRFMFGTSGEKVTFKPSGNVGIGTTNPISALHIVNTTSGQLRLSKGSGAADENTNINTVASILMTHHWDLKGAVELRAYRQPFVDYGYNGADFGLFVADSSDVMQERLTVKRSGNVGVGTTNPVTKLDLIGGAYVHPTSGVTPLILEPTAAAALEWGYSGVHYGYLSQSGTNAIVRAGGGANLLFQTNGSTDTMFLKSDGNVGIGTTTPAIKLTVNGGTGDVINVNGGHIAGLNSTPFNADQAVPLGYLQANYGSTASELWKGTKNGNIWNGDAGLGNVGIGTTNPTVKLHVVGTGSETLMQIGNFFSMRADGVLDWGNSLSYGTLTWDTGKVMIGGKAGIDYALLAGGSEKMRITSGGNVGIGTTNPTYKLQIEGGLGGWSPNYFGLNGNTTEVGMSINNSGTGGKNYSIISTMSTSGLGGGKFVIADASSSTSRFLIDSSGKIGIGLTSPSAELDVNGYLRATAATISMLAGPSSVVVMADSEGNLFGTSSSAITGNYLPLAGGSLTGNLNMGGFDILNINKLSVNTIDPLYQINGTNYSTFASSIAGGVKEEYMGKVNISAKNLTYTIDFDDVVEGSDLWVWRKTVDFSEENVEVLITPYGGFAQVYSLIQDNKLIFKADRPIKVHYRLAGRRLDWKKWPTKALNQTETPGFIIE